MLSVSASAISYHSVSEEILWKIQNGMCGGSCVVVKIKQKSKSQTLSLWYQACRVEEQEKVEYYSDPWVRFAFIFGQL